MNRDQEILIKAAEALTGAIVLLTVAAEELSSEDASEGLRAAGAPYAAAAAELREALEAMSAAAKEG